MVGKYRWDRTKHCFKPSHLRSKLAQQLQYLWVLPDVIGRSEERRVGKGRRSKRDWSSDVCSSDLAAIICCAWYTWAYRASTSSPDSASPRASAAKWSASTGGIAQNTVSSPAT